MPTWVAEGSREASAIQGQAQLLCASPCSTKLAVLQKVKSGLAPVHKDTSRLIVGYKNGPNTSTHPLQSRLPQCGDMLALPGGQEALGKWNQSPSSVAAVRTLLGEGVSRSHGGGRSENPQPGKQKSAAALGPSREQRAVQTSSSSMRAGSISRLLAWSNDTPC